MRKETVEGVPLVSYVYRTEIDPDFVALTQALDSELEVKNGSLQATYAPYNKLTGIKDIVIAYSQERPIGCAAIKLHEPGTFEVKRVYVSPDFRRSGVAAGMMEVLEKKAREKGLDYLILETSKGFAEAVGLYEKLGYEVIENYGQYKGIENSICMRKSLT